MARRSKKKVELAHRRKVVMANVLAGAAYREIAETLDVAVGTVARDVKMVLKELNTHYLEDADKWRTIQLRRTDVMLNALWEHVRGGSLQHIDRALRVMAQQDKYLGIHEQLDIEQTVEYVWHDPLGDDDDIGVGAEELDLR